MSALALLSGGLDSTVAAALYIADGGTLSGALFIDYGQKAAGPEERAARAVGRALGVAVERLELPALAAVTRTALVAGDRELPEPELETLDETAAATADAVWVPNRNGLLLNLAAALAEAGGQKHVVVGFNAEEAATFPDNGAVFLGCVNRALELSTRGAVSVVAPTLHMSKQELLQAGLAVGAPVELTWSCYRGGEIPCGRCESCRRRERAERALAEGS
jgi:7-cyano-7-deazaguanine synthase